MKFRKKGSLSFKLSRNISRVKSLKSVLNINIEGTRARRKFKREGTPESKARGHAKNLGTRARGHEGTPTWKARGHAENLGTRARGHANIEGTRARRARRARHLTDSVSKLCRLGFHVQNLPFSKSAGKKCAVFV